MGQEPVFPLIHRYAEPVSRADRRLDLQEQIAADGEKASADATNTPRPIFRNLVELECREVDHRLNGCDYAVVGIPDSYPAAHRSDARFGEACSQLPNRVLVENAIRIDRDDDVGGRVLQGVTNRARLPAIDRVPPCADTNVGEIAASLEHPFVAVVDRTVVLGDDFEFVVGIVALANALDGFVHRSALVEAGHKNAHGGLIGIVFLDFCAGERKLKNNPHHVLNHGNQQAQDQNEPEKYRGHYRRASPYYIVRPILFEDSNESIPSSFARDALTRSLFPWHRPSAVSKALSLPVRGC